MRVNDDGFAAQITHAPNRNRVYLQCAVSDRAEDWPEERIWDEMRLRFRDDTIQNAMVRSRLERG